MQNKSSISGAGGMSVTVLAGLCGKELCFLCARPRVLCCCIISQQICASKQCTFTAYEATC